MSDTPKQTRVGGVWRRTTKAGDEWFSLSMSRAELQRILAGSDGPYIPLVAFANRRKERDSHPDLEVFEARPKEGERPRQERAPVNGGATRQPDRPQTRGGHHDAPPTRGSYADEPRHDDRRTDVPPTREPTDADIPF